MILAATMQNTTRMRSYPFLGMRQLQRLRVPWIVSAMLWVFLFLIPLETFGRETGASSITVSRVAGFVLALACLLRPQLLFRWPDRPTWWGLAMMSTALIQTWFVEPDVFAYAFTRYATWIQLLLFYHMAQHLLADPSARLRAIYAYLAGAMVAASLLLLGYGLNLAMLDKDRLAIGNADPNIQACVLGLAAIWMMVITQANRQGIRSPLFWLGWPAVLLLVAGALMTRSRGGLLALVLSCALLPLFERGTSRLRMFVPVLIALIVLAVMISQDSIFVGRFMQTFLDKDTAGREYIYTLSVDLWYQQPWLGWGLGSNEAALGSYLGFPLRDMHNSFLYVLTAGGLMGTIMLGGLALACAYPALRQPSGLFRRISLSGLLLVLLSSLSVTILFFKFFWLALVMATPAISFPHKPGPSHARTTSRSSNLY